MAKLNSVRNQFSSAIRSAYRFGISKKIDRETGAYKQKYIYSTNTKENVESVVKQFCDWREEQGLPKKKICEIEGEEWQNWLRSKQVNGQISKATAKNYVDQIVKLEHIVSDWAHHSVHWSDKIVIEDIRNNKIRTKKMEYADWKTIRNAAGKDENGIVNPEKKIKVETILDLGLAAGLRVREIAKLRPENIIVDGEKPMIMILEGGKGGKWRKIPIREEWLDRIKEIKNRAIEEGWEVVAKNKSENTLSKYLRQSIKAAGQWLDKKYYKTSVHAIRKAYATQRMEEEVSKGKSTQDAWGIVSEELGHGRLRQELEEVYVVK